MAYEPLFFKSDRLLGFDTSKADEAYGPGWLEE